LVIFYWGILPIASDTQLSLLPCRGMISLMKRGAKKFKANDLESEGPEFDSWYWHYIIYTHILLLGLANNWKDLERP